MTFISVLLLIFVNKLFPVFSFNGNPGVGLSSTHFPPQVKSELLPKEIQREGIPWIFLAALVYGGIPSDVKLL